MSAKPNPELADTPWIDDGELWDTLVIDGADVPGLVSVRFKRSNNWERKAVKGEHGESADFKGAKNGDGSFKIRLWTREQWETFVASFLPKLEPEPGKKEAKLLSVTHPSLVARKVATIGVEEVEGPSEPEDGIIEFTVNWFEIRKPKEAPKAQGTGGGGKCAELKLFKQQLMGQLSIAPLHMLPAISKSIADVHGAMAYYGCYGEPTPATNPLAPSKTPVLDEFAEGALDVLDEVFS